MAQFPFMLTSPEFQVFARPPSGGNIEKLLDAMPKTSTAEIVVKLREATGIEEHMYDSIEKENMNT